MSPTIALVGNPNVGKTALFNALTGLSQSTGNYPGVTVARKHGQFSVNGTRATLIDLPGAYSLAAWSPDEMIVVDVLLDQQQGESEVDALLVVVDASNLERNLYFVSQLIELGKPMVIALNMMDIAARRGIKIDAQALSAQLGVPVAPICAHKRVGIPDLQMALDGLVQGKAASTAAACQFPDSQTHATERLLGELSARNAQLGREVPALEAFRILVDENGYAEQRLVRKLGPDFFEVLRAHRDFAQANGVSLATQEARARYAWVRKVIDASVERPTVRPKSRSERVDNILTHRFFGTVIFLTLMLVVFQSIYAWAAPLMDLIDGSVGALGARISALLPEGVLQSLLVDGVCAGVGSVLVFLPQILMLSLLIALLEDFGYTARAAFLMDRLLGWCGLSGHSFIPMLSSFACAVPGIMATRTIRDRRDRFTTILVAPLMSCSARLPVYLLLIGAFVPRKQMLGGLVGLEGLVLFLMYLLGVAVAVPMAWLLRKSFFHGAKSAFILEMPSYKAPQWKSVVRKVYQEGREFMVRAGTLIFAVTILVWALAYFPRSEAIAAEFESKRESVRVAMPDGPERASTLVQLDHEEEGEYLRRSFLGTAGRFVEPVFLPLGWDWRIATATMASFPAREIVVATLGTLFNMGSDVDETEEGLLANLQSAVRRDGSPLFTLPVALSVMVFFALCCQCGATLITIRRETGNWRWPALTFTYMTVLAYVGAFITYQGGHLLGLG